MRCQLSLRLFNQNAFPGYFPPRRTKCWSAHRLYRGPMTSPFSKKKKKKKQGWGRWLGPCKNDQRRELTNVQKTSHEHNVRKTSHEHNVRKASHEHNKDPRNSKVQTLHHGCILKRYIYDSVGTNTSLSQRWGGSHGRVVKYTHLPTALTWPDRQVAGPNLS